MTVKRRRVIVTGMGAAACVGAIGTPAVVRAQAATKLPLATVWPDGNFHTVNARRFADEVRKATGGAIDIDVKSGGQLGFKGPECLRAVRDGLVPIADFLNVQQVGDEPFFGIDGIPFLAGSPAELKVLQKHIRPEYDRIAQRNNQTILYVVPWPNQYLHLKVKAETVDALKNIKIRVADKNSQEMWTTVGMSAVLIPWGETISALSSGAVSGVSTSAVSGVDGKFWEFLKFFHATNHQWSSELVTINNDVWKKIKPEHQQAIMALTRKLEPDFWDTAFEADRDSSRKMIGSGMTRVAVPDAMIVDLRKRTAHLVADFMKRVPSSEAPIKAFLDEVKRA
jgi:TRAP-type C4-dicarboxylate transport system substrate-binding protein